MLFLVKNKLRKTLVNTQLNQRMRKMAELLVASVEGAVDQGSLRTFEIMFQFFFFKDKLKIY